MAYELIYYGNGPIMNDIIAGVTYVLNSSDYGTLLQLTMTLAGLLLVVGYHRSSAAGSHGGLSLTMGVLLVATLYYGAYSPKVDVVVYDPINHFNSSVRNVPIGAALVIWTSNKLTNGFAKLFDEAFTSSGFPDEFTYEQTGGTPSAILTVTALGNVYPSTAYLLVSVENYLKDCWLVASRLGKVNYQDIFTSSDILSTLKEAADALGPAWTTNYYDSTHPTGINVTCSEDYNLISTAVQNDASLTGGAMQAFANMLKQLGIAGISTTAEAGNLLQAAASFEVGAGLSAQSLIAQAMLVNAANPNLLRFADSYGLPAASLNSAITESALQTTSTMATSYALASVFLPMSFLVVQSFIIALLPLIFAMMFIPGLTKRYGTMAFNLLMWIAFWGPVASVINFIVQDYAKYSLQKGTAGLITFQTMPFIVAHGQTLMAVAGYIMFSVPVIAFALASGSAYALTSMVSGVTGLSAAAARAASQKISTDEGAQAQLQSGVRMREAGTLEKEEGLGGAAETYLAQGDFMSAQSAAKHMAIMMGWKKMVTGSAANMVESISRGAAMGIEGAATAGALEGQSALGSIMGTYNAYKQAVANGYHGSFAQWVGEQSKYRGTAAFQEAQAMQEMANKYFGGDLNKEMSFLQEMAAVQRVGGAIGEKEFLRVASRYGLSPVQAEALLHDFHKQAILGQIFADIEGIAKTGARDGVSYYKTMRYAPNIAAYERGKAGEQLIEEKGVPYIARAVANEYMYDMNRQFNLAPTPAQAGEKGARDAQLEWHKYEETKAISPKLQAALETAGNLWGRILAPQVDAALATDSQKIVDSYGHTFASYLKGAETPDGMRARAMVAAGGVVDSLNKFVSASVKESLKSEQGKQALAQFVVSGGLKLGLNLDKLTGGIIKLNPEAGFNKQNIEKAMAALNSSRGFEAATNVMREILTRSFTQMNLQDPDQAFAREHEVAQSLMHGDIQGVAKALNIDLQNYHKDFQHNQNNLNNDLNNIDRSKEPTVFGTPVSEITRVDGAKDREKDVKFP
ncbi:conjugal transfer protein TraG N-terminal domain-containing protein [Hippea alviniae]|uniref:conjugal transfer protein TraG N-terminal domain-containing protein n=1 Tax=Hippea alviniae TaxID=1279027 RepID=UPI0003B4FFF7|nr:conjugal transfer protein TraG N-terminal domain-containing protein [Hippea alviniae]